MKLTEEIAKSRTLLALIALAFAAIALLSDRPWNAATSYRIVEIAALPDDPRLAQLRRYTEIGSGAIAYLPGEERPAMRAPQPLKIGWAYSEFSLLKLPFWASGEIGLVTYLETPTWRHFAIISPGQRPLLDELIGSEIVAENGFRWYRHVWGWLFVAAMLLWTWLRHREDLAREEAHWAA
ncbi:MAG: hypothetical protein KF780_11540 [Sphingomonas sp.]|nr:hypothetical protein [Sphingomonas sp.]